MLLTYEGRQYLKAEVSRLKKELLLHQPRNLYGARRDDGLQPGDNRPWYPIFPRMPEAAHRNLPSLDDMAA